MFPNSNQAQNRKPIKKSKGFTKSERLLDYLANQSFLSLWSYSNVFRNQKTNKKGDGKEVCDLLVIFDNHVLIFSDKYCEFPNSGDLILDWKRWFKRAVIKSSNQLWGAERWIQSYPNQIYLDSQCTQPFPLTLPTPEVVKVHLISVSNGAKSRCVSQFGGGSGSLIYNSLSGLEEIKASPFNICDLDESKTFIHVLSEFSLRFVLQQLDTINDFVTYLDRKEKFFRSGRHIIADGEEDVLAYYLSNLNKKGEHDFVFPQDVDAIYFSNTNSVDFLNSIERSNRIEANKISYILDDLIERFSYHALNATQYYTNQVSLEGTEKGLRLLASLNRDQRRFYGEQLLDLYSERNTGYVKAKWFPPMKKNDPCFVFLSFDKPNYAKSEKDYRKVRFELLDSYARVTKLEFKYVNDIVAVATNSLGAHSNFSEDLIYLDARHWTEEDEIEAIQLKKQFSIFCNVDSFKTKVVEYPSKPPKVVSKGIRKSKISRNEICPCGSGLKYKKCCQ